MGWVLVSIFLICLSSTGISSDLFHYGCINEKSVENKIFEQLYADNHIGFLEHNSTTKEECKVTCVDYSYMFYKAQKTESSLPSNCYCLLLHLKEVEHIHFKIFPSDITSKKAVPPLRNVEMVGVCNGFFLSCRKTVEHNWCLDLDKGLNQSDYHNDNPQEFPLKYYKNMYPKCVAMEDISIKLNVLNGTSGELYKCAGKCSKSAPVSMYVVMKDDLCFCGEEDLFSKSEMSIIDNCEKCKFHTEECKENGNQTLLNNTLCYGKYTPYTCGYTPSAKTEEKEKYSVYCNDKDRCQMFDANVTTEKEQIQFAYFGCTKRPPTLKLPNWRHTKTGTECLNHCTAQHSFSVYMKPKNNEFECICNEFPEISPTISNMSFGCQETWSPGLPGPSGLSNSEIINFAEPWLEHEGFALYSTVENCVLMASVEKYYPESPGQTQMTSTVTPIPTTSTTTQSELTTTEVFYCKERDDDRNMTWNETCVGKFQNRTDRCPDETNGYAFWICDPETQKFSPPQPDRTNCYSNWLDTVIWMSNNASSSAKEITEEILENISNEELRLTSGTVIELIKVGSKLSDLWSMSPISDSTSMAHENVDLSLSIAQDFIEISSDLYYQLYAWDEMNITAKAIYSTELIQTNEIISYRHLQAIENECGFKEANLPYIDNSTKDSRDLISVYMAVMTKQNVSDGEMDIPGFTLPEFVNITENIWKVYSANYTFQANGLEIPGETNILSSNMSQGNWTFFSESSILSLSLNNQSLLFQQGEVSIIFNHIDVVSQNWDRNCVFWDFDSLSWSNEGCTVVSVNSTLSQTECKCNHLTNFGLIFDINGALNNWSETQMKILSYMSVVLCSLSSLAAAATFTILQFSKLPSSPRIMIVKNRSISMFGLFVLFLFGFDPQTFKLSEALCNGVSAIIHFFALSIFSWTLLEGRQLYKSLKSNQLEDANSTKYSDLLRYIAGYGLPLLIMTLTLLVSHMIGIDEDQDQVGVEHSDTYSGIDQDQDQYCWLTEKTFIYFFVGPVAVTLIINIYVFFLAIRTANQARKMLNASNSKKIFNQIKTWAILTFLLGHTWATGFLIQSHIQGFTYVFVALNGSSGIFLFIHTILMNDVIMLELKIKLGLRDQVELALNNSGSRITASKSFKAVDRPKVYRRKARKERDSTSSDELPRLPRPTRKPYKRQSRPFETKNGIFEKNKATFILASEHKYATTAENTSISSANSVNLSSYEQSSSESLHQKKMLALEKRSKRNKQELIEEIVVHNRLAELQRQEKGKALKRHHSNKW